MALRQINLVPEAILQRRYAARHAFGWSVVYGLVLIALLGGYFLYGHRRISQRAGQLSERELRRCLETTVTDIETKKSELEQLAFIRDIGYTADTAGILGALADLVASDAWLTHLSLDMASSLEHVVIMEGFTHSNSSLGAIMRGISDSEQFVDVVLGSSSEEEIQAADESESQYVVKFRISAKTKRGTDHEE